MNKPLPLLLCASAALFFFCSNPGTPEDTAPNLNYISVVGSEPIQKDITGSAVHDNNGWAVTTKNANGLWSTFEEIGFYYTAMPVFNGTISADFENMIGSDTLKQGGLMIRGSVKGGAPYAALRLVQNIYDPVTRPDSASKAAATGSSIRYQKGDHLYITCSEKEGSGALRSFTMEVGARRGDQVLLSKTYSVNTTSDSLYIGIFYADRSAAEGAFSVSNLTIR